MNLANENMLRNPCMACGEDTAHRLLYQKAGCKIFQCRQCGLGSTKVPSQIDPAELYDKSYFAGGQQDGYIDYVGSEAVLRREFRRTVGFLKRLSPAGGRLLEIGCAYGFFMQEAQEHFDCAGVEVSNDAVQFGRRNGLNVLQGVVDESTFARIGNVDVIVMLDVIEHLPNPFETLALCERHLNPSGFVLLTTGDFGSPAARLTGRNWRLMTPPQHLFFFTKASVHKIGRRARLSTELLDHPFKMVPLGLIIFQLPRLIGLRPPAEPSATASSIGVPVNLFDAMRVVLRKSDP